MARWYVFGAGLAVILVIAWAASREYRAPAVPGLTADEAKHTVALYRSNCAVCHGLRGEGQPGWQSRLPDGTYPAPPHNSSGHTWHHGDGLLFTVVKSGGASVALPGFKSNMPGFGRTLSDSEIISVLQYIKTFWGRQEREAQAATSTNDPYPAVSP